jgi:hypothetical protein
MDALSYDTVRILAADQAELIRCIKTDIPDASGLLVRAERVLRILNSRLSERDQGKVDVGEVVHTAYIHYTPVPFKLGTAINGEVI